MGTADKLAEKDAMNTETKVVDSAVKNIVKEEVQKDAPPAR